MEQRLENTPFNLQLPQSDYTHRERREEKPAQVSQAGTAT